MKLELRNHVHLRSQGEWNAPRITFSRIDERAAPYPTCESLGTLPRPDYVRWRYLIPVERWRFVAERENVSACIQHRRPDRLEIGIWRRIESIAHRTSGDRCHRAKSTRKSRRKQKNHGVQRRRCVRLVNFVWACQGRKPLKYDVPAVDTLIAT